MGLNTTLREAGDGTGGFLDSIKTPLGDLILYLGIVGGIVAIFMAIAGRVKHSVGK